ncbi:hypothetical protein SAICODRAFT_4718 [Saitoella complicata NRRL Y-17804]|uniref:uncharacterized protein n=1 Tax=Saitoella complicata (strain BCRC 22490 / CBS 7301 / JCM 7358 / NBRC 10748 / NRRL Y-17804) TaxID=698492 RepID=UPI0008676647|nr:uncharacterized protein SAICODRAFT_4718 [Saitoella complicata NRRL Y-17804]ODQ56540.1 hypothetical protein SAICODRAFT_4718 [Saitoella complicata NRRL Y-17804]
MASAFSSVISSVSSSAASLFGRLPSAVDPIPEEDQQAKLRIKQLHIYPIKSCRGLAVSSATLDQYGLSGDHTMMFVERKYVDGETKWATMTLKQCARLAHVRVDLDLEDGDKWYRVSIDEASIRIPRQFDALESLPRLENSIMLWKCPHRPIDLGEPYASFFSKALGRKVKLCHRYGGRPVTGNMPDLSSPRELETNLNDAYPLLVVNASSLKELNARLDEAVTMERFRPNVVLEGEDVEAWDEDTWQTLQVLRSQQPATKDEDMVDNSKKPVMTIHTPSRCPRCVVTAVDLDKAEQTLQPLKELSKYRRVDEGKKWSPCFGLYGVPDVTEGELRVGDTVQVTERGEHFFVEPSHPGMVV